MKLSSLDQIAISLYGETVIGLSPIHALWLAEHVAKTTGEPVWNKISRARNRAGLYTWVPEYNSSVW